MKTTTMSKTQVKQMVSDRVHCDKVVARKDGSFAVRRGYYYPMGMTAAKLADEYAEQLPEMQVVDCSNHYHAWPVDSYFEVVMKVRE